MTNFTIECNFCGEQFTTPHSDKLYCNRRHKEQAHQARKMKNNPNYKPLRNKCCPTCKQVFETRSSIKIYCTDTCREWMRGQYRRERDREYFNKRTPAFKARIYFRDNGKCGICGDHIDTALKHPDPRSLSLDHIIPRSKGGSHSATNLQAAHLSCNVAKGNG